MRGRLRLVVADNSKQGVTVSYPILQDMIDKLAAGSDGDDLFLAAKTVYTRRATRVLSRRYT